MYVFIRPIIILTHTDVGMKGRKWANARPKLREADLFSTCHDMRLCVLSLLFCVPYYTVCPVAIAIRRGGTY